MVTAHVQNLVRATLFLCCIAMLAAGCKSDSSTGPGGGTPPGSTITVAGKVVDNNRQPVSGVPVLVTGLPSVNTDGSGNFSIAGVTTPYSIAVVDVAHKSALVYRGLTRSDPTLSFLGSSTSTAKSANLTGKIFPATSYPEPANRKTLVDFNSPDANKSTTAAGATGSYSISAISWYGTSTTTTGTVHALEFDYDAMTGLPTTYRLYGARSGVTLLDATANPNGNDTMSVISTAQVSGTVTAASGYTIATKLLVLSLGTTGGMPLLSDPSTASPFTYNTPSISGATLGLTAIAGKSLVATSYAFKTGIATNATNVGLTIPAAPELSLPVNAATGIKTSSPFSWNAFSGGIHALVISPVVTSNPSYVVITAAASDSIPNLSAAGLGLPTNADYTWNVFGFAPFANTDAAAGPGGFIPQGFPLAPIGDGSVGLTVQRTFKTSP